MILYLFRVISEEEAKQFAVEQNLKFLETSALEAVNVEDAFRETLHDIYKLMSQKGVEDTPPNRLEKPILQPSNAPTSNSNCC